MITVISATNRNNSLTCKIASNYSRLLDESGFDNQLFSLCDLPNNFLASDYFGELNGEMTELVDRYFKMADKFVVISPEYHGSYPGVFKLLIDSIGADFIKSKRVALVGVATGRAGNLRGMDHLTALFHHLKAEVLSSKPKLSRVHNLIDEEGKITNPDAIKLLQEQIKSLKAF
jgi:chromate reductase